MLQYSELQPEGRYDGIWACASLLHLREKELLHFFGHLNLYLKEDGIIYVSGKNGISTGKAADGRYFLEVYGGSAGEDSGGESTVEAGRNVVHGRRDRETGFSLDEYNNKIGVVRGRWNSRKHRK